MPQVDLKDAIETAEKAIALALSTASEQASQLNGSNYMDNLAVRAREIEAARSFGLPEATATAMTKTAGTILNANQEGANPANANQGGMANG